MTSEFLWSFMILGIFSRKLSSMALMALVVSCCVNISCEVPPVWDLGTSWLGKWKMWIQPVSPLRLALVSGVICFAKFTIKFTTSQVEDCSYVVGETPETNMLQSTCRLVAICELNPHQVLGRKVVATIFEAVLLRCAKKDWIRRDWFAERNQERTESESS